MAPRPAGMRKAWLIEDDEMIVRLVRFKLEKAGWSIEAFRTIGAFRRAWAQAREGIPDVLVLDRNLPDGSGLELARELALSPVSQSLRCLLVSASPRDAETPEGVRWIRKPFQPAELLETMEFLVREREEGDGGNPDVGVTSQADPELTALKADYCDTFPEKRRAIQDAVARKDSKELTRLAHQLAGSAGLYGFPRLQAAAALLEDLLRSRTSAAGMIEECVTRLLAELR